MKSPRGENRREKILQVAEAIILQKGFSATSIDDILAQAHLTKGGFFYHFPGKLELARALIERYLDEDERLFSTLARRAAELSEDPRQQLLIFLNLLAETMDNLEDVHPGCLVASFVYESQLLDATVNGLIHTSLLRWRAFFRALLERAAAAPPAPADLDPDELADLLSATIEGGIILSRAYRDKQPLAKMIRQYRNYIRLLLA